MAHLKLGPVVVRYGKHLASWGYPRLQLGGLSFWSWTNGGDFSLAAYHPRSSIIWIWFIHVSRRPGRGYMATFGMEERRRIYALAEQGNQFALTPRWYHAFWQPARMRKGQWTDYLRLPFGFVAMIGHQSRMSR
jgi:hypothetical protein